MNEINAKNFFSKFELICKKLWICSHIVMKALREIFIFCAFESLDFIQFWPKNDHRRCTTKFGPEARLNAPVLESLFYNVASFQACNVTKNRLLHRCFPVKFEKFWRTPISKNIWTTASVYWLLHHIFIFTILYSTRFTFLQRTSLLRN